MIEVSRPPESVQRHDLRKNNCVTIDSFLLGGGERNRSGIVLVKLAVTLNTCIKTVDQHHFIFSLFLNYLLLLLDFSSCSPGNKALPLPRPSQAMRGASTQFESGFPGGFLFPAPGFWLTGALCGLEITTGVSVVRAT